VETRRIKEEVQIKEDLDEIPEITFNPEPKKKRPRKKDTPNIPPQEKTFYSMDDIFRKELKEGIFDKPIEILNIEENEKNLDGTINEQGVLKCANFRWSDYTWTCTNCDFKTQEGVSKLESHYRTIHQSSPIYKCIDCPKSCRKYSSCLNHIFDHRPILKFCCDVCSNYFTNILELYNHRVNVHKDRKNFFCLYCSKHFDCGSILRYHRAVHDSASKLFQCDFCERRFSVKHNLASHMARHVDAAKTRPYTCEQCGLCFRQKGNLVSHQLTHSNLRPFKCDVCQETFKTFKRLRYHSLTHSKVKNHECDQCHRTFALKTTLKVHYRIHSGVTPYEVILLKRVRLEILYITSLFFLKFI
jgi:hypothetical protein